MKELLITSTVLIAVILLLRLLLKKRVSRRLIYATWLLVALRLLIPVQFGQFEYSVASTTERLEQQSQLVQQVQENLQQPVVNFDGQQRYEQLLEDYQSGQEVPTPVPPQVQTQLKQQAEEASTVTLGQLLKLLWICGAALLAGWFLITNLLFLRRAERGAVLFDDCSSPVPVRISPYVSTPCLAGLFRPRIYLTPESTADSQTLNHVLTHELTHLKHGDHLWAWVRCLCLCIYWFDPLVWLAAMVSKRDCELACDEAALQKLGEAQRIAYGKTLLATVTHTPVRIFHTTTAMSESGKQLKERVNFIVKKPKTFFIAAVCLVLTAALTTGLVFTGCKPQDIPEPPSGSADEPETTQPTTTQPTTTQPTTTQPTTQPTTKPTQPPLFTEAHDVLKTIPTVQTVPTDAQLIAKEAINRYLWYSLDLICCDLELVVADLSQYLTEQQKEEYFRQQYRITCCKTEQQVREHIDRYLSKERQEYGYPDSTLFKDGDGNLYITIIPTCYDGYRHVEVVSQTKSKIVARACNYDEDGCYRNRVFTLRSNGENYQITKVEEDEDYQCKITVVDEGPYYQVLKYGKSHYGYRFFDSNGELRSHNGTGFHCPTITPITQTLTEMAISDGPDLIHRTYYDVKTGKTETYDYVIAIGHGKVAYLDGEPDHRVLVICDMFDRHKDSTFEHLAFAPEPMPVTEAAFSDDGSLLTLTYRIGKETEATQTVSATLF